MAEVERPSLASLFLQPSFQGRQLASATGFVTPRSDGSRWLITNWHVVTGLHPATGQPLDQKNFSVPDELVIAHHVDGAIGTWQPMTEPLYSAHGEPLWIEHPMHRRNVDAVALPLTNTAGVAFYDYDVAVEGRPLPVGISRPLSIIGFPYGRTAGGYLGIWIQGYVASEPAIDYDELPCFLIDARTRHGQSGSPVIAFAPPGLVPMEDGSVVMMNSSSERFLGIYSARITAPPSADDDAERLTEAERSTDLGFVWKREALVEIVERGVPGTT